MQLQIKGTEMFSDEDRDRIARALRMAASAHEKQRRVSGELYITHPIAVAELMIMEFRADADTVIAGLLHDTVEDTELTLAEVGQEFGNAIEFLVDGATDVGRGDGRPTVENREERDEASHVKVEEYAKRDPRLLIVKVADRWHNMQSCNALRTKNQKRLALETISFHVPWAKRIGFAKQADALEALAKSVLCRLEMLERSGAAQREYLR
jgi:(p)ppGpp synthase/HD superfamily hydrolase